MTKPAEFLYHFPQYFDEESQTFSFTKKQNEWDYWTPSGWTDWNFNKVDNNCSASSSEDSSTYATNTVTATDYSAPHPIGRSKPKVWHGVSGYPPTFDYSSESHAPPRNSSLKRFPLSRYPPPVRERQPMYGDGSCPFLRPIIKYGVLQKNNGQGFESISTNRLHPSARRMQLDVRTVEEKQNSSTSPSIIRAPRIHKLFPPSQTSSNYDLRKRPVSSPAPSLAPSLASSPVYRQTSRPESITVYRPTSRPESSPGPRPTSRPVSRPSSRPASTPSSSLSSYPSSTLDPLSSFQSDPVGRVKFQHWMEGYNHFPRSFRPLCSPRSPDARNEDVLNFHNRDNSEASASVTRISFEDEISFATPISRPTIKASFTKSRLNVNGKSSDVSACSPQTSSDHPFSRNQTKVDSPFLNDFVCKASKKCTYQKRPNRVPRSGSPFLTSQTLHSFERQFLYEDELALKRKLFERELFSLKGKSYPKTFVREVPVGIMNSVQIDPFTYNGTEYDVPNARDCRFRPFVDSKTLPPYRSVITSPNDDIRAIARSNSEEILHYLRYENAPLPICANELPSKSNSAWSKRVKKDGWWNSEKMPRNPLNKLHAEVPATQYLAPHASSPYLGPHSKTVLSNQQHGDIYCEHTNKNSQQDLCVTPPKLQTLYPQPSHDKWEKESSGHRHQTVPLHPTPKVASRTTNPRLLPKRARSFNPVTSQSQSVLFSQPLASSEPSVLEGSSSIRDVCKPTRERSKHTSTKCKQDREENRRRKFKEDKNKCEIASKPSRDILDALGQSDACRPYISSLRETAEGGPWHATVVAHGVEYSVSATVVDA